VFSSGATVVKKFGNFLVTSKKADTRKETQLFKMRKQMRLKKKSNIPEDFKFTTEEQPVEEEEFDPLGALRKAASKVLILPAQG
jgi:hypothetical protein